MNEGWAPQQRDTNRLVSACADHLMQQDKITGDQLHALCRLTWTTTSNSRYITSTKLPALADIFGPAVDVSSLDKASKDIAALLRTPRARISANTGFSNFYNAYRNSSISWVKQHRTKIERLVREARQLRTDAQARDLAEVIQHMPGIPKANHDRSSMPAEALLTPLLFSLDPRIRFPVINGRKPIQQFLRARKLHKKSLAAQYDAMVGLIGQNGWKDAADVDSAMNEEADVRIFTGPDQVATVVKVSQPLQEKATSGKDLSVKDDADQAAIASGLSDVVKRRLHNRMTNRFKVLFGSSYRCKEGISKDAMYDVMVMDCIKRKHGCNSDLLIEVKSSSEEPHVRMAIGQLYAYSYSLRLEAHEAAVLLPVEPSQHVKGLLEHLGLGCLWYIDEGLTTIRTSTLWLKKWVNTQIT